MAKQAWPGVTQPGGRDGYKEQETQKDVAHHCRTLPATSEYLLASCPPPGDRRTLRC